jgi:uncharacterized protein (TIGR00255 family)
MTGYGIGTAAKKGLSIEVEIKSVNGRYLETYLKLPQTLSSREYEIREVTKSKIKRGKLNVNIQVKRDGINNGSLTVDKNKLKNYLQILSEIKTTAKLKEDVKLEHLIGNRDIISAAENDFSEADFNTVKIALNKAIKELQQMKKKEGMELAKDLSARINSIEKKVASIQQQYKKSIKGYFNKLKTRVAELIENAEVNEDRLVLELALIADRADITEECVRLKSHLKFCRNSVRNEKEPGRKLNFLCQEMNREANTISSKSILPEITYKAVLIKEEIEKIREQIQNIE